LSARRPRACGVQSAPPSWGHLGTTQTVAAGRETTSASSIRTPAWAHRGKPGQLRRPRANPLTRFNPAPRLGPPGGNPASERPRSVTTHTVSSAPGLGPVEPDGARNSTSPRSGLFPIRPGLGHRWKLRQSCRLDTPASFHIRPPAGPPGKQPLRPGWYRHRCLFQIRPGPWAHRGNGCNCSDHPWFHERFNSAPSGATGGNMGRAMRGRGLHHVSIRPRLGHRETRRMAAAAVCGAASVNPAPGPGPPPHRGTRAPGPSGPSTVRFFPSPPPAWGHLCKTPVPASVGGQATCRGPSFADPLQPLPNIP